MDEERNVTGFNFCNGQEIVFAIVYCFDRLIFSKQAGLSSQETGAEIRR